jgi:GNAT superfamily N-acetyltransferase
MSIACRVDVGAHTDVPEILVLMRQYWTFENIAGFDAAQLSRLLKRLVSQPHLGSVWVARESDVMVGYLIAVLMFSLEYQGTVAEIDEIFVVPQARGHGIGAALVDVAESALAAAGCTFIQLQLGVGNDSARGFYGRRGYAPRSGFELMCKPLSAQDAEQSDR